MRANKKAQALVNEIVSGIDSFLAELPTQEQNARIRALKNCAAEAPRSVRGTSRTTRLPVGRRAASRRS